MQHKRLLLGLSGGPDSMALFHLMIEGGMQFEIAHVDHGWRVTSAQEAKILHKMAVDHSIPFHLKVLEGQQTSNLEEIGREARLAFYEAICKQQECIGVVLGHHGDDLAETVLKRVFEGARLQKLKGLQLEHRIGDLTLFRPLLHHTKDEIVSWLKERKLSFFDDHTNRDTRFLRAKMREEILPHLSTLFGKNISSSLCRLATYASELDVFLEEMLVVKRESYTKGYIDLHGEDKPFMRRVLVADFFEQMGVSLSFPTLEHILVLLEKEGRVRELLVDGQTILIKRQKIQIENTKNLDAKKQKLSMITA